MPGSFVYAFAIEFDFRGGQIGQVKGISVTRVSSRADTGSSSLGISPFRNSPLAFPSRLRLVPCQPSRLDADSDETVSSPLSCSWKTACECLSLASQTS